MTFAESRQLEHAKYARAYTVPTYRMKRERMADAVADLSALPVRGSYLDVSCGRGEMVDQARQLGFGPVHGTEIVPELIDGQTVRYGEVHALPFPDQSIDVVTLFDVIEHLIPGDDEAACKELARVARKHIILTANNKPSKNKAGDELHINRREYGIWHELFTKWFAPHAVTWIKGERAYISEAWRVDLQ